MPSGDPRSYVKSVPLPISSQKGIKIQARSDKVFNPRIPTREDVWRWNYERRQQQMTDQGFYSHNFVPYKGLGDPVYLDVKKMVLHSLGQENESESSSSSEEEEEEKPSAAPLFKASLVAAKFVLRRTKKDLNTLNKEMVKGRSMIRNVQLGHSLFYIIKQERLNKKAARDEEMRRKLELARTQWQPPKGSSSEDETDTDDDLGTLDNLDNFLGVDGLNMDDSDENPSGIIIEEHRNRSDPSRSLAVSAKSVLSLRKKKKKKKPVTPRPYTPMHTNLTEITADKEDISSPALFRQLCVLNWILDAMNLDQQNMTMKPISTCWRLNEQDIGGYKIPNKKLREDKKTDSEWEKFLNTNIRTKKESVTKYSRLSRPSRVLYQPRPSIQLSPSNSISQVNAAEQNSDNQGDIQPAGESMPEAQQESDEDEALYKTSVFKFLDEYYDSLRHQAELEEEKQKALGTGGEVTLEQGQSNQQENGEHKHRHKDGSHRKKKKSEKHADLDHQDENSKSRSSQPNSQKALVLSEKCQNEQPMNANKPTHRYEYLTSELRLKFKEVQEERAMSLHDVLEQLDRERFTKCQNKFSSLPTSSVSFHRALEEMRRRGRKMSIRPDDVRRQSSFKGDWYSDLINSLPYELKDLWYYKTVLHKLSKYGLMETTSKQSVLKFLKVLEGLRTWEICHPDISAAIEFCRSKIIDMTIDEYELWFSTSFPQVHRPKTAPAGTSSGGAGSKFAGLVSGQKSGEGDKKLNWRANSRADSFVSVANGSQGHVRMVQSAVIKRK